MNNNSPKNKRLITFAIALLIVLATILTAVGCNNNSQPPHVENESEEMGVYYYDAEDKEILLTLSTGNNFTIVGPSMNKTGTYTIEGNALTLDFFKDADGTATATLDGTSLELTLADAKMNFLKKIDYTVSFDVNGGEAIADVKVVNGKAVAEPNAPTKENNVFLGWYADKACTTPFSFATTPIKADTTIYARWAEKTFGMAEYTVSFDLGYNATAPESITTISGKAYGVTTPKRDGYTFGGWYVSMTNEADKLSYAYTENTVFTADTTLYAVWYDDAATGLKAPAVNVSGNRISWTQVSGATGGYALTVTAPNGDVLLNETLAATAKVFDFTSGAEGTYTVTVVALAANEENNSEPTVRYYANKTLAKVTGFQVVNGVLVFNTVENANKYIITIDCGNDNHTHTALDIGNRTTYNISGCPMQKGGINITVVAQGEGFAPSTASFNYDLSLDKIDKVVYDAASGTFIWEAVAGANEYIVTVTVDGESYVINNGSATTFAPIDFTGDITVSIAPATLGYNSPEGTEASCTKTSPAKPAGITTNGMIISWNEAAGATKYEVKIGDNAPITVEATSIDLTTAGLVFTQGEFYEVKVKAINDANEASVYSDTVKFGYFAMMSGLSYSKNTVSWAPVLGVNTFKVRVNGGAEITVTDANCARVTLTKDGDNVIEVKFVANGVESDWVSITVTAYTVEYDTRSTFGSFYTEYLAVGDEFLLPGENTFPTNKFFKDGYTFAAWATSPMGYAGASGVLAEGDVFTGNGYTVLYGTWELKTYNVILNTESRYTITNLEDGQQESVTYTKGFTLPVPVTTAGQVNFMGWFTQKNGEGIQITDGQGNSLANYDYTKDISVYPHFEGNELYFYPTTYNGEACYGVRAGEGIHAVTDIYIPVTHKGLPVYVIDDDAFNSYANIISITIPDTIKLIGQKAFRSALNLEKVEIYVADPDSTYEVFYASRNGALLRYDMGTVYLECVPKAIGRLTNDGTFTIPDEVTALKVESFRYTADITTVIIPNNVVELPSKAFLSCSPLKNVIFLERTNPLVFEYDTFYSCGNIQSFTFPSNLDMELADLTKFLNQFTFLQAVNIAEGTEGYASISGMLTNKGGDTIEYCPKGYLGTPTIPQTVTKIADNAFAGCSRLSEVNIPIWVTSIGTTAFNGASGITKVTFEGNRSAALTVGSKAFYGCISIKDIVFLANELPNASERKGITISASAFYGVSGSTLTSVSVGENVIISSIGANAFYQQTQLSDFTFEDGATLGTIGANAFDGCTALHEFEVPASVTSIGQYAFNGCTALISLTFAEATDEDAKINIATYAFNGCIKIRTVLLPDHLASFNSAAFEGCIALTSLSVNDTNTLYKSENGILYKRADDSDDFASLLFYPTGLITANGGIVTNLPSTLVEIGGSAFSNKGTLVSITLPAKISKIGNSAFANCENLGQIIFLGNTAADGAATTLSIGTSAFENCTSLSRFVLPAYTKTIGSNAFKASGIIVFTVPAGVTSIGSGAFNSCEQLELFTFGNTSAIDIPNTLFKGCTALTEVDLGNSVNAIGSSAFEGCTALRTVKVTNDGSKLTKIGNKAFYNCPLLATINIPKTVTAIGSQAFSATADAPGRLATVNFELGGTSTLHIYKQAFQYQSALKSITFPERVSLFTGSENTTKDANNNKIAKPVTFANFNSKTTDNGIAALFLGCSSLESINIADEGGDAAVYYTTLDGVLYTADMTVLIFCPAANAGKMDGSTPTYKITVPTSVTLVMSKAFQNNTKITSIEFEEFDASNANYGKQLLYIGHYSSTGKAYAAFGGTTTSITSVKLPSHLHTIRGYAFGVEEPTQAMAITFNPDAKNVTLSGSAFRACAATSLTLPAIKSFGTYVFANTTLLESVSIASFTGTSIGNYVFQNATALKSFTYPASVTSVTMSAFDGCTSLTSVTLNSKITKIDTSAFQNCSSLRSISIPTAVTTINGNAFMNCTALTSVTLPSGLTTLGGAAFAGSGIVSIAVPSKITTLQASVFKNCKSLTTASIAGQIKSIPSEAFFGCENLSSVTFTDLSKVTSISVGAFIGCEKLTSFPFERLTAVTSISKNAFSHTAIKKVDLSKTKVKELNSAFNNMPYLEEFVFTSTITKISNTDVLLKDYNGYLGCGMPFDNNPSMKKITLSSNFNTSMLAANANGTELPLYLFDYVAKNCPNLQIVIPSLSGYTKDAYGVYYSTDGKTLYWAPPSVNLDKYEISAGVETISQYAFAYSNIGEIVIPRDVVEIQMGAFMGASATKIYINATAAEPSYLAYIAGYAFAGAALESFVIPDSVTDITYEDYHMFAYCPNLKSLTIGSGIYETPLYIIRGSYALEELIIKNGPECINALVGDVYCTEPTSGYSLKHLTIPASVTNLWSSFYELDSVETITIADGSALDRIEIQTFMNCKSLKSVNIPASVTYIGAGSFYGCESLESLDLSATAIAEIWDHVFAYTDALTEVKLPETVTTIGDRAFYESGIITMVIPKNVELFGLGVFENATRLKTVTFHKDSKLTALDGDLYGVYDYDFVYDYVVSPWYNGYDMPDYEWPTEAVLFKGTTSLETVIIPNSVTYITASTFENSGIQWLLMADPTAESKLEFIDERAFAGCTRLLGLYYVENPDSPEDMVVHNYLANVIEIGAEAFAGCTSLATVDFGRSIESIGERAFAGCTALEVAYIPASVIELGANVYEGVDADKLEVAPAHPLFAIETAVDGTVYLKNLITGAIIGTWLPEAESDNPGEAV